MNYLVQLNGKWPHKQLRKKVWVNKEKTLRVSVKRIHDHNFYVPLVIIYCVFCRKGRILPRRKWGHWGMGTNESIFFSVCLTILGLSPKPVPSGNEVQVTQGYIYSLGTIITLGR